MTAPTILFLTTDLQDLDILNREAAPGGALAFAACPSPGLVLEHLEREGCIGLLIDSTVPAAARRATIERVQSAHPTLPILALTAPGDGEAALEAGATAFVTKRGPFAGRVVALMTACLEAGAVGAGAVEASSQLLSFGLTAAQIASLDRAGRATYAATVAADGLRLLDGTLIDAAAFDGALISEAGLEHATDVLIDVRSRAPHLNLVGVATGDHAAFALATERLGGVPLTVTPDELPAAIDRLVPLLQARRAAVDELLVARANELRVRAVVECAPSSIVLLDADGTCLAMNWAGLTVLGYDDAAAVVGQDFGTRIAPTDAETFAQLLRCVAGGARHEATVSCLDAVGATIRLRIIGVPLARETAGTFSVLCTIAVSSLLGEQPALTPPPDDAAVAELVRLTEVLEATARERDHYAERVLALEREHAALPDPGFVDPDMAAAQAAAAVEQASRVLRAEHEAALASLSADLMAARQSAEEAEHTIARLTDHASSASALAQRCQLVETWLHEAEARCDDLQNQLHARPLEPIIDTAAIARLESELTTLRAAEAAEREKTETAQAEAAVSRQQLDEVSRALDNERGLTSTLREAAARATALEHQLTSALEAQQAQGAELTALQIEHATLRSHVAALGVELAEANEARESERHRVSDQQTHVDQLEARVATLSAALAEADAGRHERDGLSRSLAELTASRDTLQGALEAASRLEAQLREELVDARNAVTADREAREGALDATLQAAERERDALAEQLSQGAALRQRLAEEAAELRAHLAEAREGEDALRSARDEQAAALGHARRELAELAHQHQIALADAAATKARLQATDEARRANAAAEGDARLALARERDERAEVEKSVLALDRDLSAVRAELAAVEGERDRAEAAHAHTAEELAALADALSQAQAESAALADARAQAAESLAATERELSRVTSERDAGLVSIRALEAQLTEASVRRREFEQAHAALQARLDGEIEQRARLKEQLTHAHSQSETTSELTARIGDLEQQLAVGLAQARAAAADLVLTRGERDRLAAEHARLTTERDQLAAEHDRFAAEHDRFVAEHERRDEERQRLAAERDALEVERRQLSAECDRLARAERTVQSEAAQRAADLQRLRLELESAVAARTEAAGRLETAHEEVASLRASLTAEQHARRRDAAAQAEARAHHSTAQRLQTELDHTLAELTAQQRQVEEYRVLHVSLESGLRSAEATLDQLAETQRHERSRSDAQRKELERVRVVLRDRERDLQRVKGLAQSAKDSLERERAAARSEAAARRSAEQAADARARDLEVELTHLQAHVEALEMRVRDRDARWTQFWNEAPVGLATTTTEGRVLECNPVLADWLDVEIESGQGVLPAVSLDAGGTTTREFVLNGRDGGARYVLEHASCRREQQQLLVERTLIDISRAHSLASELREAKRFESVGRLTVRMIDDLYGVVDRLGVFARQSGRRVTAIGRDPLGDLSEATSQALDLVRQLQQHAKRQLRNDPEFAAAPVLQALRPLFERVTGDDIEWRIDEVGDATLATDRHAFEHLLTTLAVSAREALPEGGVAILKLSSADDTPRGWSSEGGVLALTVRGYGLLQVPDDAIRAAAQRCGGTLTVHPSDHACRWQVSFADVMTSLSAHPRSRRAS